jgi:hypothetical protein
MNNLPKSNIEISIINTVWELWRQRFYWLNELLTSILCNFRDLPYIIQRLNENAEDSVDFFRKYYGYDNAKTFELLFTNTITLVTKFLGDIKTGNKESANTDRIMMYKNADDIASFLSGINRYWDMPSNR